MQDSKSKVEKLDDKITNVAAEDSKKSEDVVKEPAKKVATKKTTKTATKSTTKKSTTKSKDSADKGTSTRTTLKTSIYIQHAGKEIEDKDIVTKIKEVWVSEFGKKLNEMKTLTTYIKPEEQSIYYVINDSITGRIDF